MESWQKVVIGALLTTIIWVLATFITPPNDEETLKNFIKKVNPGGPGWEKLQDSVNNESCSALTNLTLISAFTLPPLIRLNLIFFVRGWII